MLVNTIRSYSNIAGHSEKFSTRDPDFYPYEYDQRLLNTIFSAGEWSKNASSGWDAGERHRTGSISALGRSTWKEVNLKSCSYNKRISVDGSVELKLKRQ
jgi:hypothetical protein